MAFLWTALNKIISTKAAVINNNLTSCTNYPVGVAKFFKDYSLDSAKVMFWKLFQCWATKECTFKAEVSDEEVALFFDQLTDLVAAAYIVHQANRVSENPQEGDGHV